MKSITEQLTTRIISEVINDKVLINEKAGGAGGGRVDDRGGAGPTEGMVPFWTPKGKGDGVKLRGHPKSPMGLWDGLGQLFQRPGELFGWGDATVDPPWPDEKMQEHGHWVNYGGEWYRWMPGIGDNDGRWQRFDNHDDYLPPFDGPPSRPGEKNRDKPGVDYEYPPGSGVWFEWIPDPNHPDGGVFGMPSYRNPGTGEWGAHPASPNATNPFGKPGDSRF